jgi:hypothetical protein
VGAPAQTQIGRVADMLAEAIETFDRLDERPSEHETHRKIMRLTEDRQEALIASLAFHEIESVSDALVVALVLNGYIDTELNSMREEDNAGQAQRDRFIMSMLEKLTRWLIGSGGEAPQAIKDHFFTTWGAWPDWPGIKKYAGEPTEPASGTDPFDAAVEIAKGG